MTELLIKIAPALALIDDEYDILEELLVRIYEIESFDIERVINSINCERKFSSIDLSDFKNRIYNSRLDINGY